MNADFQAERAEYIDVRQPIGFADDMDTLLLGADLPSILKLFSIGRLPLSESSMMRTDGRTNTPPGGAGSTSTRSHRSSWIETSPGSMRSTSRHKGRLPALIFENEIGTRTEFGAPVEAACVNAGTAP
ncbi:MAG TPA: hypothetical protein VHQ88_00415 [Burkholderiales bacterium]|nr:hypothetical protein [Burkholderiales bacterium]